MCNLRLDKIGTRLSTGVTHDFFVFTLRGGTIVGTGSMFIGVFFGRCHRAHFTLSACFVEFTAASDCCSSFWPCWSKQLNGDYWYMIWDSRRIVTVGGGMMVVN